MRAFLSRLFPVPVQFDWQLCCTRFFGAAAALLSFIFITVYVFAFNDYAGDGYLFSDMQGFWNRAIERINGEEFSEAQFMTWPPIFHIYIAELFELLAAVSLAEWQRLETILAINIFLYSVSVYALQRMAVSWHIRPEFVFAITVLYAFGFPAWYFNAFLLSENFAAPLLVIAIAVMQLGSHWRSIVIAAVLFGFAGIVRPSLAPFGLAFVIFFLAQQHKINLEFIKKSAIFSAVFFAIVLLAGLEVSRISNGKVSSISSNGGLDFLIARSNYHKIETEWDGWHQVIVVPGLSWKPENGALYATVPFYQQSYYYDIGWQFVKNDPLSLLNGVGHLRNLFFADMLPSRYEAPGFGLWRPIWDWFKFFMFLTIGLFIWFWRLIPPEQRPLFAYLVSALVITFIVSFIFTGEPRYTYSIIFMFYLLFFKLIQLAIVNNALLKSVLPIYLAILSLLSISALAISTATKPSYPEVFAVDVQSYDGTEYYERNKKISRLLFPFTEEEYLQHADTEDILVSEPAKVTIRGQFEVIGSSPMGIQFELCSGWASRLVINEQVVLATNDSNDYTLEQIRHAWMPPGIYDMVLELDYWPGEGGFALHYSYWEEDGWRQRQTLGVDSERVVFTFPGR